ncbi:MAG: hypothetical protein KDA22_14615 [Phycisphaerales bacterium]|nr:hypothetical protein [Phycisphaerales bacterium]
MDRHLHEFSAGSRPNPSRCDGAVADRLAVLEARVLAAESAARRAKRGTLLLALGFAGAGVLAAAAPQNTPEVVRTQRLEIIDGNGRVAVLASATDAGGRLDLWSEAGANVFRASVNEFGGDVAVWDGNGRSAAGLFASAHGGEVGVYGDGGAAQAAMASGINGGGIVTRDAQGHPTFAATSTGAGGRVALGGPNGADALVATAHDGGARLAVLNSAGGTAVALDSGVNGGVVAAHNLDGAPVAFVEGAADGGTIRIADPARHTLASLRTEAGAGAIVTASADDDRITNIAPGRVEMRGTGTITLNALETDGPTVALALQEVPMIAFAATSHGGATIVRSAQGIDAVSMGADAVGAGVFRVASATGRPAFTVASGPDGGVVQSYAPTGVPVVGFGGLPGGFPGGYLSVLGPDAAAAIDLRADERGSGRLRVNDARGSGGFAVDGDAGKGPALAMTADGTVLVALAAGPAGGLLNLMSPSGRAVVAAGSAVDGNGGAVSIRNGAGSEIVQAGVDPDGAGVVSVLDAAGEKRQAFGSSD